MATVTSGGSGPRAVVKWMHKEIPKTYEMLQWSKSGLVTFAFWPQLVWGRVHTGAHSTAAGHFVSPDIAAAVTSMLSWLLPPKKGRYAVPSMWEALIGLTGSHEAESLMTYDGLTMEDGRPGTARGVVQARSRLLHAPASPENQQGHFKGLNQGIKHSEW